MGKKKVIKSLDALPSDVFNLFEDQYPKDSYQQAMVRMEGPNGTPVFIVPLETADIHYLVKVPAPLVKNLDAEIEEEEEKEYKEVPMSEMTEKDEPYE